MSLRLVALKYLSLMLRDVADFCDRTRANVDDRRYGLRRDDKGRVSR